MTHVTRSYGLLAEFVEPDDLVRAAWRVRQAGYRQVNTYTPFPVDGLPAAIGFRWNMVAPLMLLGGTMGGAGGFFMQWYANVIDFPQNIAGKPYNSWPAFIPVTFEMTILGAALTAVVAVLVLNGLPMLYHPVFNDARFRRASTDRFFLCIKATDREFDSDRTRNLLESLSELPVTELPW